MKQRRSLKLRRPRCNQRLCITKEDPAPHGYGSYAKDNNGWGPYELHFPTLDSQFHTYGLYWSPERLIYYVDSKPVFRVKDIAHMADVPHFFLFNVSLSRNGWGKSPDKNNPSVDEINRNLPNELVIDYFRACSGTLEEALPTAPSDVPHPVTRYSPPLPGELNTPATRPTGAPVTPPKDNVPDAPANSKISTPSGG